MLKDLVLIRVVYTPDVMHTGIDIQYATNGAEKHEGYYLPVVWQLGEHTTAPCRLGMKIRSRIL
jgi:hypothetical protein